MSRSDLKSVLIGALNSSGISVEPPLASAYRTAIDSVCGVTWLRLREGDIQRLDARQVELAACGIDYDDYAATVVKTWWGWCKLQGMSLVPVTIFCGPKALARYKRYREEHVNVDISTYTEDVNQQRFDEEYLVAQMYVSAYPFASVEGIRSSLETTIVYPADPDIVLEVLARLNSAYGLNAKDYEDLAEELRRRFIQRDGHVRRDGKITMEWEDVSDL